MVKKTFKKQVQVTNDAIKKKFKNVEPEDTLFELTWNGIDAKADIIDITISRNEMEGIELITIFDNGIGINFNDDQNGFYKYDDSNKIDSMDSHGEDGIGRFSFHKLCYDATWYSKTKDACFRLPLNNNSMNDFNIEDLSLKELPQKLIECDSGTLVELANFHKNLTTDENLLNKFSIEFGWVLAFKPNLTIKINGLKVYIPDNKLIKREFDIGEDNFKLSIYRWIDKPTSEKSNIYFINENNQVVEKLLNRFNNKPTFYTSVIVKSSFNDRFEDNFGDLDGFNDIKSQILVKIYQDLENIYMDFLRESADELIEKYEEKGYFGQNDIAESSFKKWKVNTTKALVKEIYLQEPSVFHNLKEKPAKILIKLLERMIVSNENDTLFDILDEVLQLEDNDLGKFSDLIKKSSLENIISTVEVLSKRLEVIKKLKTIMVEKYKEVLETPDLQKVIEANTWLFGEQYNLIGFEEHDFNQIAKNLRKAVSGMDEIEIGDLDDDCSIEGSKRQVDLFLASKTVQHDERGNKFYKCLIIEIKRPSVSLGKKHLRQLEDYAEIIEKHSGFSSDAMRFELILVGRKISSTDTYIRGQLESSIPHQEKGLVSKKGKIKLYVRDWFTLLDELELSNSHLFETLKLKLPDFSLSTDKELIEELIEL